MKMPTILYHFCAAHMVDSIQQTGLRMGKCPVMNETGITLIDRCQWLTAERDPRKQSWATKTLLPYDRTVFRLTVQVPGSHRKKLIPAREFVGKFPPESRELTESWEGSDKWYIFRGSIPASWIVGCRDLRKP